MRHFIPLLFLTIFLGLSKTLTAQNPAIMDANVSWSGGGGSYGATLTIFMTDSTGISGVQVKMGSQPGLADLDSVSYTGATNGNFGSNNANVSMSQNNISVALGNFTYHSDYYVDIEVLLQSGTYKEIQIHSSN